MPNVSVTVDTAAIQSLFEPVGGVGRFGQRVTREASARAKVIAPKDTGRLASSIFPSPAVMRFGYRVSIGSNLPYSDWVNHGTTTPITPKRGMWLAVGKRSGWNHGKGYAKNFVRGQAAQRFLEHGIEEAFAANGIGVLISF